MPLIRRDPDGEAWTQLGRQFGIRWLERARGLDPECEFRDTDGDTIIDMVRDGSFALLLREIRNQANTTLGTIQRPRDIDRD